MALRAKDSIHQKLVLCIIVSFETTNIGSFKGTLVALVRFVIQIRMGDYVVYIETSLSGINFEAGMTFVNKPAFHLFLTD